jgi:hypothetical protein
MNLLSGCIKNGIICLIRDHINTRQERGQVAQLVSQSRQLRGGRLRLAAPALGHLHDTSHDYATPPFRFEHVRSHRSDITNSGGTLKGARVQDNPSAVDREFPGKKWRLESEAVLAFQID